jgi:hypothetical protein
MRLSLGDRDYDLTTRALVMGTVERASSVVDAVRNGADIVEVGDVDGTFAPDAIVPVCVAVTEGWGPERALASGPALVWFDGAPSSAADYAACAKAGASVVVAAGETGSAERAGIPPDRIVVADGDFGGRYPALVDVTGSHSPTAATAVAVVRGARIVRTADVRGARRICDVLAAVMEAGAGR